MKSLRRIRNRRHRCFELAFKVMMEEPEAERLTLVHGYRYNKCIDHAWVETDDGRVYDVVEGIYYDSIKTYTGGVAVRRYSQLEAAQASIKDWTSGPWHKEMGPQHWK
jgi:hypothetical protein